MEVKTDSKLKHLYTAAHAGNIDSLKELLREDELLLDKVVATAEVSDNPLHIAVVRGYSAFAKEILQRKPNLAHELNRQGLSPLHLAVVHGHFLVAKQLLQIDPGLCYVQENKDGYLPVHIAVIKGRHDIITLLLEKCKDSVNELTYMLETLIHLAVKAKRSETVEFLTEQGITKLMLNAKDGNGNTSLHLAVAGRQQKVSKHLLSQPNIDVNSINTAGLTPLDLLLVTNHEIGDLYFGEMLRAAGGKTAKELGASKTNLLNSSSTDTHQTSQARLTATPNKKMTRTRSKIEKASRNMDNNLIVVATLVATVTFAAALNPPGGAIQMAFTESDRHNQTWLTNWEKMDSVYPAGSPVYMWQLRKFFMYDYFALFASVSVILLCLPGVIGPNKLMRKLLLLVLWSAMLSMVLAFTSALSILLYKDKYLGNYHWFSKFFNIWACFFVIVSAPLLCVFMFSLIDTVACKLKQVRPSWISKLRQFTRWAKIKKILSIISMMTIGCFVGIGICFALYVMHVGRDN